MSTVFFSTNDDETISSFDRKEWEVYPLDEVWKSPNPAPFGTYAWVMNLDLPYTGPFLEERKDWNYGSRVMRHMKRLDDDV